MVTTTDLQVMMTAKQVAMVSSKFPLNRPNSNTDIRHWRLALFKACEFLLGVKTSLIGSLLFPLLTPTTQAS